MRSAYQVLHLHLFTDHLEGTTGFKIQNNTLNQIRNRLRLAFQESGLEHSIDTRHTIRAAHATVVRFKDKLEHRDDFLQAIAHYREHSFGSFTVEKFELVINDWYQRAANVTKLSEFDLK